ncbi:MAG: hypothetical protein ACP5U1_05680 [Desulfomonilaceae bacterium]
MEKFFSPASLDKCPRDLTILLETACSCLTLPGELALILSPGEIHFLWWFIQGSVMNPSTRERLRKGWGMCERHTWGWMVVEASFRAGYLHGPAVLYEDLMRRALASFDLRGIFLGERVVARLRDRGPCMMCEEGYNSESKGIVKPETVERGRQTAEFKKFLKMTCPYWFDNICGKCFGNGSGVRCRRHLIEDYDRGCVQDLEVHRNHVSELTSRMERFARSFQFEYRGTQTPQDSAALVGSIGWLSGWSLFLEMLETARTESGKTSEVLGN